MPNYSFRCEEGCGFDAIFPMAQVPAEIECRGCGGSARRAITAPHLSGSGDTAFQLVDRAASSAHEPTVVTAPPAPGGAPNRRRVTRNPLHAKLPRP